VKEAELKLIGRSFRDRKPLNLALDLNEQSELVFRSAIWTM
jgi:hypothetical protein